MDIDGQAQPCINDIMVCVSIVDRCSISAGHSVVRLFLTEYLKLRKVRFFGMEDLKDREEEGRRAFWDQMLALYWVLAWLRVILVGAHQVSLERRSLSPFTQCLLLNTSTPRAIYLSTLVKNISAFQSSTGLSLCAPAGAQRADVRLNTIRWLVGRTF
jgi:hypothetical protein